MSLPPEIQQQHYAAIELAYSERRWTEVESLSQELLQELADDPADPLRLRLVLLLGHTRLYGMGDTAAAREHYTSVRDHGSEPTLLEIAKQGLEQCLQMEQPTVSTPTAAAPWLSDTPQGGTAAAGSSSGSGSTDAAPWLSPTPAAQPVPAPQEPAAVEAPAALASTTDESSAATGPSAGDEELADSGVKAEAPAPDPVVAEIVEEPEQIAVALADPQRREEVAVDLLGDQTDPRPALAGSPQDPLHFDADAMSPEELRELSRGLLRLSAG